MPILERSYATRRLFITPESVQKMSSPRPRLTTRQSQQHYQHEMQQAHQWLALHRPYDDAEDCGYPDW